MLAKDEDVAHLVQTCPDVGTDDELDALDLGLDEHDAEMLVL